MRQKRLFSSLIALSLGATAGVAHAAPTLRKQVDQKGDFVIFGNTVGFECATGLAVPVPEPVVGTSTCPSGGGSADERNDSSPDIFWMSDSPAAGQATASTAITAAQARSTAMLDIPTGATITYGRIYWAGLLAGNMSTEPAVSVLPPGGVNTNVPADEQFFIARGGNRWYQSTADITSLLTAGGEGAYRVSDIGSIELDDLENNDPMVAWVAVVLYSLPSDPPRNLTIFDGLDLVSNGNPAAVSLSGFLVPNAGFDAKLGVIAYEGEQQHVGDSLVFNGVTLSNGVNDATNFFNSTRSYLGAAVSNVGDLPQLTGGRASMAGVDMDVVDVKAQLAAGDTSADIAATSSIDTYLLGAFVTSISTFKPDFSTSGKTFTDVNGGVLLPGDILEYTITVTNTGNDASVNTIMTDALPVGVTYVPGSISVTSGPGVGGPFTDAADTDAGEYVAGTRTVRVRVGNTPFAASNGGGRMAVNATAVIKFRVTIDATASGSLFNQAIVTASGEQGAPSDDFPTDGNGNGSGVPPTETIVDKCATNAECAAPTPACDTAATPNVCVECVVAADCTNPAEPQCLPDHTCGCTVGCGDTDSDGLSDATEGVIGTNPNDADSDDDGVKDGDEPSFDDDTDDDGTINALDPDSDDDGLYDGTELGLPCDGAGTEPGSIHCIADGDAGTTKTDPLDADSDDGGVRDGSEDVDHDGEKDATETDPTAGNGDDDGSLDDGDGDGLTDDEEDAIGTDPMDGDSDDDGVIDGDEVNPSDDADGDGLINALDPDSDNDGLYDGTELGLDCGEAATDASKMHCRADADPDTVTNPVDADTDDGGVDDGSEDFNRDGAKDAGETDPTAGHGADDGSLDDDDGDGLTNGVEDSIGTDSDDADSDDDGVQDGDEPNFADDTDNDGNINALDTDSDDDGLLDGTELGKDCMDPATDAAAAMCVADADDGATTTNPLDADTDNGGVSDGDEDENHDGKVDAGERDPNDGSDDVVGGEGGAGGEGGEGMGGSSMAGSAGAMVMAGNGGLMTAGNSATGGNAGSANAGSANAGSANAGSPNSVDGILEGGGCACRTAAPASSQAPLTALVSILGLVGVAVARRRRRQS
jgi:clumping factor A